MSGDLNPVDDFTVRAVSEFGRLPVLGDDYPDGPHAPQCAGCGGERTSETCPFSIERREYAERFEAALHGETAERPALRLVPGGSA